MFDHPVIILSIFTLTAVLAIGFWQWSSVRRSQAKRGETPGDVTMTRHEPADTSPSANVRNPVGGTGGGNDVSSYKLQDKENELQAARSKTPLSAPANR